MPRYFSHQAPKLSIALVLALSVQLAFTSFDCLAREIATTRHKKKTSTSKDTSKDVLQSQADFAAKIFLDLSGSDTPLLKGEISETELVPLDQHVDDLVELAMERATSTDDLAKKGKHYSHPVSLLYTWGKDLGQMASSYKGLEQSSEAADVILGSQVKLKSKAAVEYAKQLQSDAAENKIFASLMQIAMGLGLTDPIESQQVVETGMNELAQLVGQEQADQTLAYMRDWIQEFPITSSDLAKRPLSMLELDNKAGLLVNKALEQDRVMLGIKEALGQFNHRSKFARASAKIVNTTLAVGAMTPTIVAPASQVAWAAFVMLNGGPEEAKLLKEVYLSKRFDNRRKVLDREVRLSVDGYNTALLTQNKALLSVCDFFINKMAGTNSFMLSLTAQAAPVDSKATKQEKSPEARSAKASATPIQTETDSDIPMPRAHAALTVHTQL